MSWVSQNIQLKDYLAKIYMPLLQDIGLPLEQAKSIFNSTYNRAKEISSELIPSADPENNKLNYGDYFLEEEFANPVTKKMLSMLRKEGVTDDIIREWWNATEIERQFAALYEGILIQAAYHSNLNSGMDKETAIKMVYKYNIIYGESRKLIDTDTNSKDRPFPYEMKLLLDPYIKKIMSKRGMLDEISRYSSCNAFIRENINLSTIKSDSNDSFKESSMDKAIEMKQMIEKYRQNIEHLNNYCIAKNEIFTFASTDVSYSKEEITANAKMEGNFVVDKYVIKKVAILGTEELLRLVEDLNIKINDTKISSIIVHEFEFMYLHCIDRVIKNFLNENDRFQIIGALSRLIINDSVKNDYFTIFSSKRKRIMSDLYNKYNESTIEYSNYNKLLPNFDQGLGDTLLWEFGKKISLLLGIKDDNIAIYMKVCEIGSIGLEGLDMVINSLKEKFGN